MALTSGPVAVIGAGMAGAACVRALADYGMAVRVFDKGRSVGGRLAQRRTPAGTFDHGAQYLGARDPEFAKQVTAWRERGLVADWPEAANAAGRPVTVGVPAMNAPVKALLDGLSVDTGFRVAALVQLGDGWAVRGEGGATQGPFAAVLLAVPAAQAVQLLETAGPERAVSLILRLGGVRMAPCWSLLVAFEEGLALEAPALRLDGTLAWAARNGSKPGRGGGECWTVHAGPAWSAEHLERSPDAIAPELLAAFAAETGIALPTPSYLAAHRWRYALVERPLGDSCIWDPAMQLGLCGDWCIGPRIEAAWLSGRAMAAALANGRGAR